MKKLLIALLLSVLLIHSAFAEPDYTALINDINLLCGIYRAPEFDISSAAINSSDNYKWTAFLKNSNSEIDLMLFSKNGNDISSIICACSEETIIMDYLACCCAVVSEYRESLGVIEPIGYIFYNYLLSRGGQESVVPFVANSGAYCSLKVDNGRYILTIILPS